MHCTKFFSQTEVVTNQNLQLLGYVTFFDILHHYGVIAASLICSVEKVLCRLTEQIFLVEAEVVVAKEWGNTVVGCRREVVKVEELKKTEKKQEYQDKLKEAYDRVKEREAGELEEEWGLMKESLVGHASDMIE